MRLGYNTWAIPTLPYDTVLPGLAQIGYRAVALSVVPTYGQQPNATDLALLDAEDRQRIATMCNELGLELHSVVGNQNIIEDDAEKSAAALRRLRETIDFCAEVTPPGQAVPVLCTGSGGGSAAFPTHKEQLVERLGALGEYAARQGVIICLEPHVNDAIDTPERATWVIAAVNQPSVRLDFDVSHFAVQGYALDDIVPQLLPLARSTEIKDQHLRYTDEPEPAGWRVANNGGGQATAPNGRPLEFQFLLGGEGDFDLPHYLRLMHAAGWTGPVCFEASLQCIRRPGFDPLAVAAANYRWMRAAWEQAAISDA